MHASEIHLTPLRAFRIALNLDSDKICRFADISRSYLTRLEQGVIPTAEVAERIIKAMKSGKCARKKTQRRPELLEASVQLFNLLGGHAESLSEMHLLYPERFVAPLQKDAPTCRTNAPAQ